MANYNADPYIMATDSFYARYLSRKAWPPEEFSECEDVGSFNTQVYNYMWGPTEFTATGTLKDFDRISYLSQIKEPILFMTGEYDEARPETIYKFQKMSNNAVVEIIRGAAHWTMVDQPERVALAIKNFLKRGE